MKIWSKFVRFDFKLSDLVSDYLKTYSPENRIIKPIYIVNSDGKRWLNWSLLSPRRHATFSWYRWLRRRPCCRSKESFGFLQSSTFQAGPLSRWSNVAWAQASRKTCLASHVQYERLKPTVAMGPMISGHCSLQLYHWNLLLGLVAKPK